MPFDSHIEPERYLTADVPGTGGVIKARAEDFFVEELPSYEPCGEGEHIYLFIEKTNLTTSRVARALAEHFGVRREGVGVAGLKDRLAVTRQMFSVHVPGKKPEDFSAFEQPGAAVMWVDRHTNKLRRGHLAGNRFIIRIRGVDAGKVVHAAKTLRELVRIGAPNRFGAQRFGLLGLNHEVGVAFIKGEHQRGLDLMLGMPPPRPAGAWCPESQREARRLYGERQFPEALDAMPRAMHTERRLLGALARGAGAKGALRAMERFDQSFMVTAFQSAVFNRVLDARIGAGTFAELMTGDLAFKHENGAVFAVTEDMMQGGELKERLARLEISASGPMWGALMTRAAGEPGRLEDEALAASGVSMADLERVERLRLESMEGKRRPVRVPIAYPDVEGGQDEHGPYIKLRFELPRGAFATSVLQEIMKGEGKKGRGEREEGPEDADDPGSE